MLRNRMPFVIGLNPDRDEAVGALNPNGQCGPRLCADRSGFPAPGLLRRRPVLRTGEWLRGRSRLPPPRECGSPNDRPRGFPKTGPADSVVGLLVFFAAHPTVLSPSSPVYSGDFASVAMGPSRDARRSTRGGLLQWRRGRHPYADGCAGIFGMSSVSPRSSSGPFSRRCTRPPKTRRPIRKSPSAASK